MRKRRQEARIRVRLAADAVALAGHHASAPPGPLAPVTQAELAALRREFVALRALVLAEPARGGDGMGGMPSGVQGWRTTLRATSVEVRPTGGMPGPANEEVRLDVPPHSNGGDCEMGQERVPQPGLANAVTGDGMLPIFQNGMVQARHEAAGTDAKVLLLSAAAYDEKTALLLGQ